MYLFFYLFCFTASVDSGVSIETGSIFALCSLGWRHALSVRGRFGAPRPQVISPWAHRQQRQKQNNRFWNEPVPARHRCDDARPSPPPSAGARLTRRTRTASASFCGNCSRARRRGRATCRRNSCAQWRWRGRDSRCPPPPRRFPLQCGR